MNNNINLHLKMNVDEDALSASIVDHFITSYDDNYEQMAEFALKLGENGDLTYELHLLKKISDLFIDVYGDIDSNQDELIFQVV